jgi:hypothetical protein
LGPVAGRVLMVADPELRAAARNCMETTIAVEVTAELLTEGPEGQRLYDRMVE